MVLEPAVPTVAIYNNLETFFRFLQRASDHKILEARTYHGDRGIFWLGPHKLLITTKRIPDAEYICNRWGYSETSIYTPRETTYQLSLDVLNDSDLLQKIVQYAGPQKSLQLIPYAATPEFYTLVKYLQDRLGLEVTLAESPFQSNLWIRDYIDTKTGFRSLIPEWIREGEIIPPGFICRDINESAYAVDWFSRQGLGSVVKADRGESGLGHLIFQGSEISLDDILLKLHADPFLNTDLIVVDQFIQSEKQLSPSLELFVPANGQPPSITYISSQLFSVFGQFAGVLISRELTQASWYPRLAKYGLHIAQKLQKMGYVGHFDIDTIVDDHGHIYLLEINTRRTGGTYVHEFAVLTFGKDYLNKVSLLCNNAVKCNSINKLENLVESLDDLLFPISGEDRGIVITVTSSLLVSEFGCILVAPNEQELLRLKQEMLSHLQSAT
jgi:hypothetical protein